MSERSEFSGQAIGVLLTSIVLTTLGPSGLLMTTFSLFIDPMSAEFGWTRASAAGIVSILAGCVALGSPLKGYLVDRFGARATLWPLTMLMAAAITAVAIVPRDRPGLVFALFALIGLLAPGNIPFGKAIAAWFERRRGVAYGILGLGLSLGIPIGLQAARWLIDAIGWRQTYAVFGLVQVLAGVPLLAWGFRDAPVGGARAAVVEEQGASLRQALSSRAYWLVVGNLCLGVFALAGLLAHGVPLLAEHGLDRRAATNALSALTLGITVSQPILGWLLDRWPSPRVALPFALAAATGLVLTPFVRGEIALSASLFLFGLGAGGETGTTPYFIARYFGLRRFSVIYGSVQPINLGLAVGLGVWSLGLVYDHTGGYRLPLTLMGLAAAAAAALLLLLPAYPARPRPSESA